MPHLVFSTPLSLEDMRRDFTPFHAHDGDIHIGFVEAYRGRKALLFEIHVSEPTIEQHTGLMLVPHTPGEYTLQMSTLGHPRPTQGMQIAVRALSQWLIGLSPDARLVQSSLSGGLPG